MISFACKEIEIKDLIKCSFDLSKTDYVIFEFLIRSEGDFSVRQLAEKLDFERSSVQKSIKDLTKRNLVIRRQLNLDQGGYKFYYSINNKDDIKKRIENIIDGWHKKVKDAISSW